MPGNVSCALEFPLPNSKVFLVEASAIEIVGYVPDYRFNGIDWNKALKM